MSERRSLTIHRIDQVMPEVDRLLDGHTTVGNWSLAQICNHLASSYRMSVEGFGVKIPWLIRATIGRLAKREILGKGEMRTGIKLPEEFRPKPGLDHRAEAEALRAAIAYYLANPTPRAPHPIMGKLTNDEWDRFHCVHAAHHLRFAIPH